VNVDVEQVHVSEKKWHIQIYVAQLWHIINNSVSWNEKKTEEKWKHVQEK